MAERSAKRRKPSKDVDTLKREIADREAAAAARKAARKPSGAAARPDLQFKPKKLTPGEQHEADQERRRREGYVTGGKYSYGSQTTGSRGRGAQHEVPSRFTDRPFHREEVLVDYLLDEGFASDEKSASAIASAMSEEWKQSIVEASEEDKERLRNYEVRYYQKHGGMPADPEKRRELRDAARRLPPA